jgi:hypothetical protein
MLRHEASLLFKLQIPRILGMTKREKDGEFNIRAFVAIKIQ